MGGAIDLNRPVVQMNHRVATRLCYVTSSRAAATRCSPKGKLVAEVVLSGP